MLLAFDLFLEIWHTPSFYITKNKICYTRKSKHYLFKKSFLKFILGLFLCNMVWWQKGQIFEPLDSYLDLDIRFWLLLNSLDLKNMLSLLF